MQRTLSGILQTHKRAGPVRHWTGEKAGSLVTLSYFADRPVFPTTLMRLRSDFKMTPVLQEPNLNACGAYEVPCVKRICQPSEMW
uniref:Uncharacterized protein n=1 Tax=Hyaloperonospora arabidopsidis (strain Emoy2) TaxID=559515 RepID=M4BQ90_HYAAE